MIKLRPLINHIPCFKCGCPDTPKVVRRRKERNKISISTYCILCHREDAAIRNRRLFKKNKDKRIAQAKKYKDNNREEYNESQRIWYAKNKERICAKARERYVPKTKRRFKRRARPTTVNKDFNPVKFSILKRDIATEDNFFLTEKL